MQNSCFSARIFALLFTLLSLFSGYGETNLTVTLGPEVDVGAISPYQQYQSDLRVDPMDPDRMIITVKNSDNETATAAFNTLDGGDTWNVTRMNQSSDPDVVFDQFGHAYWTVINLSANDKPAVSISTDGGAVWSSRATMSSTAIDHAHSVVDRSPTSPHYNSIYLAGRLFNSAALGVVRSRDQGETWQTSTQSLSGTAGKGFVHQPWVMRDGTLIVPVKSENNILIVDGAYAGNMKNIYSVRSTNGGETFESPVFLANRDQPASGGPGSGVSRADAGIVGGMWNGVERLYFAFPFTPGNGQPSEIRFCTSDDGGLSWSEARVITPTPPSGKGYTIPSLMINPDGVIGLQFFEVNGSSEYNVYFSASSDGGETFSPPVRISPVTGKEVGFGVIPRELGGDQIFASAAADGTFRMVWTDNRDRDGFYSIYYRKVSVRPADLSPDNDPPVSLSLIGGAIVDAAPAGTVAGTLRTSDPDDADTHTYTIVAGDSAAFQIEGNQLKTAVIPNRSSQNVYTLTVRSTDPGGLFVDRPVDIAVHPAPPPPPEPTTLDSSGAVTFGDDYSSYADQDLSGTVNVSTDGSSVALTGNNWKKFPVSYFMTANTMLAFTVEANDTGEIIGVGLEDDNLLDNNKRIFQIGGSQTWASAWQIAPTYTAGSGAMTYVIPAGTYYTGSINGLVLGADDDADESSNVTFSGLRIYEAGDVPGAYEQLAADFDWGSTPVAMQNRGDDPDEDGVSNIVEFAFGTSPTSADAQSYPKFESVLVGESAATVKLSYPAAAGTFSYQCQYSKVLTPWNTEGFSDGTLNSSTGMTEVEFTIPKTAEENLLFFRVFIAEE